MPDQSNSSLSSPSVVCITDDSGSLDAELLDYLPPRRARTRWRTAPAVMLNSRAVLSSGLWYAQAGERRRLKKKGKANDFVMIHVHLPAGEDETLLWRRNARLLLDFLLDPSDLRAEKN